MQCAFHRLWSLRSFQLQLDASHVNDMNVTYCYLVEMKHFISQQLVGVGGCGLSPAFAPPLSLPLD